MAKLQKHYYVYMLASQRNGTIYLGFTGDLIRRIWQHREKETPGFSSRYSVNRLVWFEQHGDVEAALQREKQLKNWKRVWKLELINSTNPGWKDLYPGLL